MSPDDDMEVFLAVLQCTNEGSLQVTLLSRLTLVAPPSQTSPLLTQVVTSPGRKLEPDWSQAGDRTSSSESQYLVFLKHIPWLEETQKRNPKSKSKMLSC